VGAVYDRDNGAKAGAAYVFSISDCAADFNGDGAINSLDILYDLRIWASGDAAADFNADGRLGTGDVQAYLDAWIAGC